MDKEQIINEYRNFISGHDYSCVAARQSVARQQQHCFVAGHMACPAHDHEILNFLYGFIDTFRSGEPGYYSASVIFPNTHVANEMVFEDMMWQRLQALSDADAIHFGYDKRVSADPMSPDFSFSLKEESFFILGLHPSSSRESRRFQHCVLAFNPHQQFERMRDKGQYQKMKNVVRKRELSKFATINPMLDDFGRSSEVFQYSGRMNTEKASCPLIIKHGSNHRTA